jgi:hypothetical protein
VPQPDPAVPVTFSFAQVKAEVFTPRCARCHSGMVSTYEKVIANLSAIESKIASGQMPPARAAALTDAEKQLVLRWIALGAPEMGGGEEKINPAPPRRPAPPCLRSTRHGEGEDDRDLDGTDRHDDDDNGDDRNDERCDRKEPTLQKESQP